MPYPYTIHLQTETGGDAGKVSITLDDKAIEYIASFPYGGIDAVITEVAIRLNMAKPEMLYRLLAIQKGEEDAATIKARAWWQECEAERAATRGKRKATRAAKADTDASRPASEEPSGG